PDWDIESLVVRDANRLSIDVEEFERKAILKFKQRGRGLASRTEKPKGLLEWLSLMQHHGGPTRLIDFTYSFWVALFFATEFTTGDCAIYLLNTKKIVANNDIRDHDFFLSCLLALDKDHIWVKKDKTSIQMCIPNNLNKRISIQQGLFVYQTKIHDSFAESCNASASKSELKKLIIKESIVNDIKLQLSKTNCISSTLFPGIDGYARSMRNLVS
ncbi:MAG: FRG domain-containing protein, partial [Candidatus Electrothrix sp. AR3]|nr:FRG domain-containing protein [Candidatus Electrothrix sp. AR3]